jgi:hypothetical protein
MKKNPSKRCNHVDEDRPINNSNFKCDKITPDRHTFRQTHSDRHIPTDTFRQTHSDRHIPTDTFRQTHSDRHIPTDTFRQTHSDRHIPTDTFRQTHSECLVKMFCGTGVSPRTRINKFDRRKKFIFFVVCPNTTTASDTRFFIFLFVFVCLFFFQFHSILVMRLMPLLTKSMGSRPRTL